MSEPNVPDPSDCDTSGFLGIINCGSGSASDDQGTSANALFAAIGYSFAVFGAQVLLFMLLRMRLSRIYRPRSYLVPEKERVPIPPAGIVAWLKPLFNTPNLAFIQKCGLDAYFFLRYLRMLLKIFFPLAVLILPILLPINRYSGTNQSLDRLSISNIDNQHTENRLWAHLILAIVVIVWVCYVVYREMRGYIRVRQAFLTSPQHRIRASATTVLVTGIPRKWLTLEALNGLYDVFPGGIRNIWINRNFDELADKVKYRNSLAKSLEDAESSLVKMCWKKNEKAEEQRRKKEGRSKKSKQERRKDNQDADAAAERMAQEDGVTSGDRHETRHSIHEALHEAEEAEHRREEHERNRKANRPFGILGDGFGAIGQGFDKLGKGVGKFADGVADDVNNGFHKANDSADRRANLGNGFVTDDELYRMSMMSNDIPPTPPPKTPAEEREARLQSIQNDGTNDRRQRGARTTSDQQHPFATIVPIQGEGTVGGSPNSQPQSPPDIRTTGPSIESKPRSPLEIEEPDSHKSQPKWKVWKSNDRSLALPSPQPHTAEEDEFPLTANGTKTNGTNESNRKTAPEVSGSKWAQKIMFWQQKKKDGGDDDPNGGYPESFVKDWDEDQDEEPYWRRYLEPKERETMRVPLFSPTWCPSLPLVGKKVDRIYWLRRELARMNLEVEIDQNDVERFPFMNSAFIQFNHQVAAHMACQSLSHHIPQHMAPRLVEISPDDVIWDNMSIKWWERYIRTGIVLGICAGLIIFYAIPVAFTSLLSKVGTLANFKGLEWIRQIPTTVLSMISGILPPLFLAIILALVPIIFRALVKQQGVPTGTSRELGVQQWYFAFLFIQVFFVVTISGGITAFISTVANNPNEIVSALAQNLPKASNYFFSYLMIQALSNSASSLLQVASLLVWFILGPILDSTARAKWRRQTTLQYVRWGSFFPPFTNFAVIGLVYSVIAPLILAFMIIIFGLFWIVWRYNVLYVYQFRNDTGGLLFPSACNQLFVGLYVMELCLVGFFFISRNEDNKVVCVPQAIIMIVMFILTVLYQWILNSAFRPLFQYLPITLEDEAVLRDEEFARAQASKFTPLNKQDNEEDTRDIQDVLAEREQTEEDYEDRAVEQEMKNVEEHRRSYRNSRTLGAVDSGNRQSTGPRPLHQKPDNSRPSWKTDRWRQAAPQAVSKIRNLAAPDRSEKAAGDNKTKALQSSQHNDVEAQQVGDVLFSGFADELEDLTPEERDVLVRYAFQHGALRARRPVIWIPRDRLGVSDDEIKRAKKMSTVEVYDNEKGREVEKTNIWMSNEGTALNGRGKVVFRRSPPDFSNVDLIAL